MLVLPALTELHLSGNKFLHLPAGCFFPNLHTLTIQVRSHLPAPPPPRASRRGLTCRLRPQDNSLGQFGASDLRAYPRLRELRAGRNQFECTCEFVLFFRTLAAASVRLADGEDSYVCDAPLALQGAPVSRVRLSPLHCHRVLLVSGSCAAALLLGAGVLWLLWRVHAFWYLRMTWAWLRAKRSSRQRRRRPGREERFDAFVSYSERDAGWVENFLVPELEQPR